MFLVINDSDSKPEHILVFEDPRVAEPGFPAAVIEDVSVERPDCTAGWPYGFPPPDGAVVAQNPADPKRFKVFESEGVRTRGHYLQPAGQPRGPYRSWSEYLRERERRAA